MWVSTAVNNDAKGSDTLFFRSPSDHNHTVTHSHPEAVKYNHSLICGH